MNNMEFEIDFNKMKEVYGDEILELISINMENIEKNIETLKKLKFDDICGIFERCPNIFMNFPKQFERKINRVIYELGKNYVELIENNIEYIENL